MDNLKQFEINIKELDIVNLLEVYRLNANKYDSLSIERSYLVITEIKNRINKER